MKSGELSYSVYGPMKKASVLNADISKGNKLKINMI